MNLVGKLLKNPRNIYITPYPFLFVKPRIFLGCRRVDKTYNIKYDRNLLSKDSFLSLKGMKKILIPIVLSSFSLFLLSAAAFDAVTADTSCQQIFGGGETCRQKGQILLNKTVLNPKTSLMVDNLSASDPKYEPNFIVTFRLIITNTGKANITNLKIKDIFPKYVNFNAGPGSFDPTTRTLSFSLDNLKASQSRTFIIMGTVASEADLLENKEVIFDYILAKVLYI